jgi:hypothetical protein
VTQRNRAAGRTTVKFAWTCSVRDDSRVIKSAQHVAFALASFMNGDGECKPSLATLADRTGLSKTTIIKALRELVTVGYLEIDFGGGRRHPNIYRARLAKWVDSIDPYVRHPDGRGLVKRVEFQRPNGRVSEPEGKSEGRRSVLDGELDVGVGSTEAKLANELRFLSECDELVLRGEARWVA